MKFNDFQFDLQYSLEERDNKFFDDFYYRNFPSLIFIEFINDIERQRKGIDKILHFKSGRTVTIDEKKRRTDYGDILLEIWSVLERKIRGWLYTCQAEYLVYAIMPSLKAYILPTILLKRAWLTNQYDWLLKYPEAKAENDTYITLSICIPPDILLNAILAEMERNLK